MSLVRRSAAMAVLVTLAVAGQVVTAGADPAGTTVLNATPTDRPAIGIAGASSAGLLYSIDNSDIGGVDSTGQWLKPTGQPAVRAASTTVALEGSMVFRRDEQRIYYRTLPGGTERSCPSDSPVTVMFIPTGWLVKPDRGSDTYTRVTAGPSGCTSEPVTTIPDSRLVTADSTGFVIEVTTPQVLYDLTYVPFSDRNPRLIDRAAQPHNGISLSNGTVAWADQSGGAPYTSTLHRWTEAGQEPTRSVDGAVVQLAVIPGLTAFVTCATPYGGIFCSTGSIPAGGGQQTTLTGAPWVTDDGTNLYVSRFGASSGIDRGTSLTSLTRILTVPKLPPYSFSIALGASRLGYVDTDGTDRSGDLPPYNLHWRYAAKSGGRISLLPAHSGGSGVSSIRIDGRRQVVGRTGLQPDDGTLYLRTEGGSTATIFNSQRGVAIWVSTKAAEISGTRVLWYQAVFSNDPCEPPGCPQYGPEKAMLYDVRTGRSTELGDASTTKWALWGSYVVWATKDGSIYRRDLSSNKTVTVKSKGYGVIGLGVWGSYVGWSECVQACFKGNIAYRNLATGAAPVRVATPVVALVVQVTGGHVVYGISDGPAQHARWLREVRIGSTATATIGEYLFAPGWSTFAAHDEVLAWIGRTDGLARVAPNSAYTDPPKFLGNALGSSSFKPSAGQAWTPEFAISKALPTCQVVIRGKVTGSVLRRLACASSTGSARTSWNGRIASGRLVPKGSYSWTLTGSDSDGALRWWTGATTPITGSVTVA